MKKSLFGSLLSLSIVFALQAQTEPEKTPLTGKSPAASAKKTPANPQPVQTSGTKSGEAGTKPSDDTNAKPIDPSNMDPSVKPADDFFLYANGGWIKRTEIPPEYSRWGSFNQLIEHNNDALHAIAEKAAKAKSNDADASKKLRDQYVAHVTKMLTLLGESAEKAGADAKKILALETALAQASRTRVELRDPQKNYNKMTPAELQTLTPDWNWGDYFKEIALTAPGDIDVHQPDFFKAINTAFTSTLIDDWKTYLRWHLINATASALSSDFVNEDFNFRETTLRGTEQIKPRWKRVIISEDGEIGEALGKLYAAEYFPPAAKARALELINNLKEALADRIKTLEWMDEPTKKAALEKLAAFQVKIGYPEKWRDYSALMVDRGPFVLNELRAENFESKRQLNKIGKPVDRTEWGMTPPTVNAYYNPKMNEIVFPAGILQPPFFYANADDAVNYGGIGAVIGHEMTHGFDDQGRQYDPVGNLRDWWSPQSAEEFKKRSEAIINQYNEYEPLPGLHVNGALTQGENIADVGGVKLAYAALQKALDKHPEERNKKIDGLTPEQRFFLSFAAIWRQKIRDEDQKLRLNVDPHSPGHFRVNGPLSDLPEFAKAFDVPDGAPMVRAADKRVNIW